LFFLTAFKFTKPAERACSHPFMTRRHPVIENIKRILIGLTSEYDSDQSSSAIGYGLTLAQKAGADTTVQAASTKLVLASAWIGGLAADLLATENRRLRVLADAAARMAELEANIAGVTCEAHTPHLAYPELVSSFITQARVHDLTVVDAQVEILHPDRGLIERLLNESGRPIIVVPAAQEAFRGRRVIVAWDGSASAARASGDALPFLRAADAVQVVTVTGEKELPQSETGAGIARKLERHGASVTVRSVAHHKGDAAHALREAAATFDADLIVMGGFVHSRLRQLVLGGVTQSLLNDSHVPLLLSH
jgi:nucleotide-binding universal stress UspA family protein